MSADSKHQFVEKILLELPVIMCFILTKREKNGIMLTLLT